MDTILHDSLTVTPNLILDFDLIDQTYDRFINAFPSGDVYYAVKANASMDILRLVVEKGGGLEIASVAELDRALDCGAAAHEIICSNPIKNPFFLEQMHYYGVYAMVVDSTYEIDKVAQYAPGSRVYVRLAVDNTGSVLPLAGKFGVSGDEALALFDLARDRGLEPIGLSFHVGSQCLAVGNWANAIAACGEIWREAEARGHHFHFLDIGGGFPAGHYHNPTIPTVEAVGEVVMAAIAQHIPACDDLMLVMEPGRGLVGESGRLLASVVGMAERGGKLWAYLDAGVFNGLMETYEGFPPVVRLLTDDDDRPLVPTTLAGPSCDSCDVIVRDLELPTLRIGDRLVFYDAGAYTNEYAVPFNGFPIPVVTALRSEREALLA
ncbi:MAG: type III PLP-dependent enzyme [Anaerolineae bacterium]|nr:type III PLP-dependent enzyme [Anaerolineae bacterium]